uniref:Uncharacterized protein n=1 Tax=Arundo donax TaxID=35708 RepID=A0A0A9CT10_ARUDO
MFLVRSTVTRCSFPTGHQIYRCRLKISPAYYEPDEHDAGVLPSSTKIRIVIKRRGPDQITEMKRPWGSK